MSVVLRADRIRSSTSSWLLPGASRNETRHLGRWQPVGHGDRQRVGKRHPCTVFDSTSLHVRSDSTVDYDDLCFELEPSARIREPVVVGEHDDLSISGDHNWGPNEPRAERNGMLKRVPVVVGRLSRKDERRHPPSPQLDSSYDDSGLELTSDVQWLATVTCRSLFIQ